MTEVEKEARKYDVDVSVKRELTWPEGAVGIPLMLAIAEELLRTAMANYIDMKQEMADRITHAWEYMCECLQIGRRETETHMSSNHLQAKCPGARIAPWWSNPSPTYLRWPPRAKRCMSRYETTGVKNGTRA